MKALHPYLHFNDNCREAFAFYKSVFGGDFAMMMDFTQLPPSEGFTCDEDEKEKVMHVGIPVGTSQLMGSDVPRAMGGVTTGDNFSISIEAESDEEADSLFAALSEGGQVKMPMAQMFWGSYFGMCTDRFGINWMVSHDRGQA